ncbi:MAG: hypothetical protein ACLU38_03555 [Dysosmobacter sp.]
MELRIDFMDRDVPDCLTMTFGVYDNKHLYENQKPPAQSTWLTTATSCCPITRRSSGRS